MPARPRACMDAKPRPPAMVTKWPTIMIRGSYNTGTSFVDTYALNFDPDPGFWPNFDLDPALRYQF